MLEFINNAKWSRLLDWTRISPLVIHLLMFLYNCYIKMYNSVVCSDTNFTLNLSRGQGENEWPLLL